MVGVLVIGGAGGYFYLKSIDSTPKQESPDLADFPGSSDVVGEEVDKAPSNSGTKISPESNSAPKTSGAILGSGKDCGSITTKALSGPPPDDSDFTKNGVCMMEAIVACSPARLIVENNDGSMDEFQVTGKEVNGDCGLRHTKGKYFADSDGYELIGQGPIKCLLPQEVIDDPISNDFMASQVMFGVFLSTSQIYSINGTDWNIFIPGGIECEKDFN